MTPVPTNDVPAAEVGDQPALPLGAIRRYAPIAALTVLSVIAAVIVRSGGHSWGDDFALYINQARGLVEGTAGQVVADNRFAMDNSSFASFTPIAYPWGTSLLLMPIIAVVGIDYTWLKAVPTVAFAVAVVAFWCLVRRRMGAPEAIVFTGLIAVNPWYVWAADSVLSDLVFLAVVMVAVAVIEAGYGTGTVVAHRVAVASGVLIAVAAHIRREALGLLLVLAVVQAAQWWRSAPRRPNALGVPWGWFAVVFGIGHLLLPAPILGNVDVAGDPGPNQIIDNLVWYRASFAELIGLKDAGDVPIEAFGSEFVGHLLMAAVLVLAVVGALAAVVGAVRRRGARDLSITAAVLGMGLIVMMTPYHYQRYLMTLVPLVLLLMIGGVQALVSVAVRRSQTASPRRVRLIGLVALAVVAPGLGMAAADTVRSVERHLSNEFVHRGPEDVVSQELFAEIRQRTDERDVVAFFQPRSMNLYTRRLSILARDEQTLLDRADWFASARDSDYLQIELGEQQAEELGLVKIWENAGYVLWELPDRP